MAATAYADTPVEYRTFTEGRKWFSSNDDKAWGEKFYIIFLPIFFAYNALIQQMGWLDVNDFWHVTLNLLMWVPYCIILPMILRRNTGIPFHKQWWFKFQVYMAAVVFLVTYWHTEYFFEALGMRYWFPQVSLYLDSALLGPDQATALENRMRIPVGMYLNTMAFFTVYHAAAIVVIRRLYNFGLDTFGSAGRTWGFIIAVAITAFFFAWAETFFYMSASQVHSYYINLPWMLKVGSWFYMLYFIFLFPNIYWLDENAQKAPWTNWRAIVEGTAMAFMVLTALDLWVLIGLPTVPGPA